MKITEILRQNDLIGLYFDNGELVIQEEGHYGVPGGYYCYTDKYSIPQFEEEFNVSWSEVENDLPSKAEWEESERRNAELENQTLEDWD